MTTPTTQDQKYTPEMIAAQTFTALQNQRQLTRAAVDMAEDNRAAADLANGTVADLRGRISAARQTLHMALNNPEMAEDAWALSEALAKVLQELEGDK